LCPVGMSQILSSFSPVIQHSCLCSHCRTFVIICIVNVHFYWNS
jgi:hypothetical protein